MCIITLEEKNGYVNVKKTCIYARHTNSDQQLIVYSMSIQSDTNAAMILPVPVKKNSGEDAIRFIDMSMSIKHSLPDVLIPDDFSLNEQGVSEDADSESESYKSLLPTIEELDELEKKSDFFEQLSELCFPEYEPLLENLLCNTFGPSLSVNTLVVHDVGDYVASYVPSMNDFDRLSPCFRLNEGVWEKLPDYRDFGFVVFQLKTTHVGSYTSIPPMAFEFPTSVPEALFFPTTHVHGGGYDEMANYDHVLYCQRDNAREEFKYQRDLLQQKDPSLAKQIEDSSLVDTSQTTHLGSSDEDLFLQAFNEDKDTRFKGYRWFLSSNKELGNSISEDIHKGCLDPINKLYGMTVSGRYKNMDVWLGQKM